MLPSLLAQDIKQGLKQFLVAAFEPADSHNHGLMRRFVDDEEGWLKGPYVQIGLPFSVGQAGKTFFQTFQTDYPGYSHQEQAWNRLASNRLARSTLVATGTGSGKTECFLYPMLDHCTRARAQKEAGIKALVIYPMNALASDQARRMAELVANTPQFAGLRVGLYVGGHSVAPGQGTVMTPTSVITDRDTLRKNPPDILLTNYKMLDYLLLRPKDRQLWAQNTPTTLRYVVVDELHTFDGAQGTDLALLLRRLRARLKVEDQQLLCAGTSATLGSPSDTAPLREYARQIFGVPFDQDAVVTETRKSVTEFLDDSTVDFMFAFRPDIVQALEANQYKSIESAVEAWFPVFFPDEPRTVSVKNDDWRKALGGLLKRHQLFVNLLKLAKNGVVSYSELVSTFTRNMPAASPRQVGQVLDALLVLVAWARGEDGRSLVNLRLQLWVRELRRMVGKLSADPEAVELTSEADLAAVHDGVYLPMVQCRQCRTTGWLSRLAPGSSTLSTKLDEVYNSWFSKRPETTRLYAGDSITANTPAEGLKQEVCTSCGHLQYAADKCGNCGNQELFGVFRVMGQRTVVRGTATFTLHDDSCPGCGERGEQLLLGARNATLGSQVVDSTWASVFNDDKKLIAFSDSVQDAAHRAGFFGARTWQNNVRTALAHVLDEIGQPKMAWSAVLGEIEQRISNRMAPFNMKREELVSEFIAPNMTWLHEWDKELTKDKGLSATSRLPDFVKQRLLWQTTTELTYLSQRGRTLERIGKGVLAVPWADVRRLAEQLLPVFYENYGMHSLDGQAIAHWLWGLLTRLRRIGAVMHPELVHYAGDGDTFPWANRRPWLPRIGPSTPRPIFLTVGTQREFDRLAIKGRATWYDRWARAALQTQLLAQGLPEELAKEALQALVADGLLILTQNQRGNTWAVNPDRLVLYTDVAFIATAGSKRRLAVPQEEATYLLGMPCLDAVESSYTVLTPNAESWWAQRFSQADLRRVVAAEHTGLLERDVREALESRFKSKAPKPWYENLLSATPTLEMGVDIGDLSSVLLCSVPPSQASFLQRVGRAGRRDGNAVTTTLADGNSPHDLYFFAETQEMLSGEVNPPGVFLQASEVLRRQLFAFCLDDWVASLGKSGTAFPEKTSQVLDVMEQAKLDRFPYLFLDYVVQHEERLYQTFTQLLTADLNDEVRARLLDFIQGQDEDKKGLRVRLTEALEELLKERTSYKKRKDEIDRKRKELERQPQDDATKEQIDILLRERDKLLELIKEINGRDMLNTLTDAGLIPNYAFPEAGVELKSVLWRKRAEGDPAGPGAYVTLNTLKYERPAQSALSEFAPENRFYANQRRVEIDQINMGLAKTEDWRFCPACHYMQNLSVNLEVHHVCPRCGDAMWEDAAQKRTLLRFKQAIANSNDTEVRIDDSADDREPKYYLRQLMADFSPKDIHDGDAWQLNTADLPFGFEFIRRVIFRDVNFGELAKPGEQFKVADKESVRPGFRLCKYCGKVQKPPRGNGHTITQDHALDCEKHGSDDPANLLECLYLYREFESEALRILVPYTKKGVDDQVVQSFMAAVQLGLKKHYRGQVDHLRMVMQDEPGKDGGTRRHYVMLYDAVPGGTGYLHQLLADQAKTLCSVLQLALDAVSGCACNSDPGKDGCYRCVYQYRLGRNMALVSRDTAKAVLTELVGSLDNLQKVPSISSIAINPNFESVLEARFIESLKRLGGAKDAVSGMQQIPPVKLVPDVVNGKSGFVMDIGGQRYKIEPQRDLKPDDGIAVASRPDFVIWPWSQTSSRRPIAVFCDGWAHHKDIMRQDARKRSALVASGKFWVWSVTYPDVAAALKGELQTDLGIGLSSLLKPSGARPTSQAALLFGETNWHAVARLLRWLSGPVHAFDILSEPVTVEPGMLVLDDETQVEDHQRHQAWRQWLHVYNAMQVSPGMLLMTTSALNAHEHEGLTLAGSGLTGRTGDAALQGAWGEVLKQALATMLAGLTVLAKAGAAIPDVGTELADADGKVVADAELCWSAARLALLRDDQADLQAVWQAQGWTTMLLSENQTHIADQVWHVAVALHLGVTLTEE